MLVGALALIAFAYYYLILSATYSKVDDMIAEIDRLEMDIAKKKGIAANLEKFREEVRELDQELTKALRELPDKKSIDILLSQISDKARNSGLEIVLFQPSPERFHDFYAEIPVQITVNGGFHQLAAFFNEVGDLDRIVNLTEYSITKNDGAADSQGRKGPGLLESSITATSFRFLEEDERKAQEDAKSRNK